MNIKQMRVSAVAMILVGCALVSVTIADQTQPPLLGLSLTVGVKHSDNRDSTPSGYMVKDELIDKKDQTEMWIQPTISLNRFVEGKYRISLSYSPSYTYFDNPRDGGTENELSHTARGLIEYYLGARTELTISDNYWWSGNKDWYYGEDYVFAPDERELRNDDYYKNELALAIKRDVGADNYIRVSGRWNIKRYDKKNLADYGDEDEYVLLAEVMRREGRHLSYGVYSEFTAFDRSNGGSPDAFGSEKVDEIDTGVQYLNTGIQLKYDFMGNQKVVLSARTGYNYLWYKATDIKDDDMIGDSVVELLLFQQARTSGKIGLKYGKEYGNVFPYSSQDNTTLFASVSQLLGRKSNLRVGIDAEYRTRKYELVKIDPDAESYGYYQQWTEERGYAKDATLDTTFIRLYASYKWTADLSTSLFYSYEDVDSEVDSSYTVNTVGFSATYRFQ